MNKTKTAICPICTVALTPACKLCSATCGHVYHKHCMSPWLSQSQTCPTCRRPCTIQSTIPIYLTFEEQPVPTREEHIRDLLELLEVDPNNDGESGESSNDGSAQASASTSASSDVSTSSGQTASSAVSVSASDGCRHPEVAILMCSRHFGRISYCDCRDGANEIDQTSFGRINGVHYYCVTCGNRHCSECSQKLSGTCVRYDDRTYHEKCFPCRECSQPLNRTAKVLTRPSRQYHTSCLFCTECHQSLKGKMYYFVDDEPRCRAQCI